MWDERFEQAVRTKLPMLASEPRLRPDLSLRDFGLDSMKIMDLIVGLESAYGTEFPDEALTFEAFATPGRLWELVREHMVDAPGRRAGTK
ncbi:acyl carrier protein [Amycolatopsis sp. A1MSW2902]|uniref:acyl carrier protein n=1 Tax=Amycolatopsis TaxID=1813 RepID=UPI0005691A27|nr:acyl carrier protein [Amycolatopsis nivea]